MNKETNMAIMKPDMYPLDIRYDPLRDEIISSSRGLPNQSGSALTSTQTILLAESSKRDRLREAYGGARPNWGTVQFRTIENGYLCRYALKEAERFCDEVFCKDMEAVADFMRRAVAEKAMQ